MSDSEGFPAGAAQSGTTPTSSSRCRLHPRSDDAHAAPPRPPFGPKPQPLYWDELAANVENAHSWFDDEELTQAQRLEVLDKVYREFADRFEDHLCSVLDTPRRRRSHRAEAPHIRLVTAKDRAQRHFKAWSSLLRPLHWLRSWTQDVIGYITAVGEGASTALQLREDLMHSPAEFQEKPMLIELHAHARNLMDYVIADELAGFSAPIANETAFRDLLEMIQRAESTEQRLQRAGLHAAWKEWVSDSQAHRKGWAHKWTALRQHWRPRVTQDGFSGRPLDLLTEESERLQGIWECSDYRAGWFDAPEDAWKELPPVTASDFIKAANTFPCRSSQTWDGFHPRHFGLLREDQCTVAIRLYQLLERVSSMPTTMQGIFGKLIPKHKPGLARVSLRSIGLLPSLYRHWQRLRQPVAREWENNNRCPHLGHQAGRSIMETVFIQSLRSEASQIPDETGRRSHSAAFLWDLSNYYEFVNHDRLFERARRRGMNLVVVAIALNQYRAQRFLGLSDVACSARFPSRGIAAGDGWATTFVQVYSIDSLESWATLNPRVHISLFIDDFMGDSQAQEAHEVAGRLTAGAASLKVAIETELECSIAAHKSVLIASSEPLLRRLKTSFGKYAGTTDRAASNLGVVFFVGRRRAQRTSTFTMRGRADKFRRKHRRLQAGGLLRGRSRRS